MHYPAWQRFWWTIYWLFLIVSFCVIGFFLVTQAMGYRYNPHTSRYQKTGMVVVSNPPRDSLIELDGQTYPARSVTRIPTVLPGNYRVRVTKENYLPWEKSISVESGYVINLSNITLFLIKPIVQADPVHYRELLPYYATTDGRVRIIDGELWMGTTFVSRFSEPPSNALLLPTERHIVYLRGNEVRVIETTGEQDQLLYTRASTEPTPFALVEGMVVFQDGPEVTALQIQ